MTEGDTFTTITGLAEANIRDGGMPSIERLGAATGVVVVRISFVAGQVMDNHKSPFPILVQSLSGEIDLSIFGAHSSAGESADAAASHVALVPGVAVHVEGGVVHRLEAISDAVVTLLILR